VGEIEPEPGEGKPLLRRRETFHTEGGASPWINFETKSELGAGLRG